MLRHDRQTACVLNFYCELGTTEPTTTTGSRWGWDLVRLNHPSVTAPVCFHDRLQRLNIAVTAASAINLLSSDRVAHSHRQGTDRWRGVREQLSGLFHVASPLPWCLSSCRGNIDQREEPLDVVFASLSFDWTCLLRQTAGAQLSLTHKQMSCMQLAQFTLKVHSWTTRSDHAGGSEQQRSRDQSQRFHTSHVTEWFYRQLLSFFFLSLLVN